MSAELGQVWLGYALENLQAARWALEESGLLNCGLQNAQQAVEKALKAVWVGQGKPVRKTHYIADLAEDLAGLGMDSGISEEECDLLDAVYMPSKYPAASALPDGMPDTEVAKRCLDLAERTCAWASRQIGAT